MHNEKVIMTKIKTTLKEFLSEHVRNLIDKNLSPHEVDWGGLLGLQLLNANFREEKKKD